MSIRLCFQSYFLLAANKYLVHASLKRCIYNYFPLCFGITGKKKEDANQRNGGYESTCETRIALHFGMLKTEQNILHFLAHLMEHSEKKKHFSLNGFS